LSKWSTTEARYHAEERAWLDVQPSRVRCVFCPGWSAEGTAEEMRDLSLVHRSQFHPETLGWRRPRPKGQLRKFRPPPLQEHEIREIEEDVKRRAFLNGLEV
jgi:hypothetical protein